MQGIKKYIKLMSAGFASQLMNFAFLPVITSIYSPENLGTLATAIGIVTFLAVMFSLRFDQAIPVVDKRGRELIFRVLLLSILTFFILCVLLIITVSTIMDKEIVIYIAAFALFMVPCEVLFKIINAEHARERDYGQISISSVVYTIPVSPMKALMYFIDALGLFFGHAFARIFWLVSQRRTIYACFGKTKQFHRQELSLLRMYWTWQLAADVLNAFTLAMVPIGLAAIYSFDKVGYYALAVSISSLPLVVISRAISQVFKGESATELRETGKFGRTYNDLIWKIIPLSAIFFIIFHFLVASLVPRYLHSSFYEVSLVIKILVPYFYFQFLARSFSYVFILSGRQKEGFWIQLTLFLSLLFLFLLSKLSNLSFWEALTGFSLIYSAIYMYVLVRGWRLKNAVCI